MNWKRLKQAFSTGDAPSAAVVGCIRTLDKSIPACRTTFLIAGLAGALLTSSVMADYVFAAGLLLHFTIWFENWWLALRVR